MENLTIRFPTERATAFSLIPREILCSIKDWEGKIRYQPATGEIDGEELQREREREEILVFLSWQFHTYPFSTPQQCISGRFPSFRAFLCQPSKSFSSPPPPPARNVGSLWADGWFPFNVFHRLIFFPPCWFEGVVASSKEASIGVFPPPPRYHPRILRILPLSLSFLHPLPLFFCLSRSLRGGNSRTKGEMFTFAICLNFLFLFFFSRIIIGLEEKL